MSALFYEGALAQSFNCDLDVYDGPPEVGNGAPSKTFAGAAGQPGYWNRVLGNPTEPWQLLDLAGMPTGATLHTIGDRAGVSGINNPANTGDYALLLNDAAFFQSEMSYVFRGLTNGEYTVFTYAVLPVPRIMPVQVSIAGSSSPNPQVVAGPMPGNAFALYVTHARHEVLVDDETLTVRVRFQSPPAGPVNGFQLTLVPTPNPLVGLGAAMLGFIFAARRRPHPVELLRCQRWKGSPQALDERGEPL